MIDKEKLVDDAIDVLLAYKDGKPLQWMNSMGCWIDRSEEMKDTLPDLVNTVYRVKQEPKKVYLTCYGDVFVSVCDSREEALMLVGSCGKVVEAVLCEG